MKQNLIGIITLLIIVALVALHYTGSAELRGWAMAVCVTAALIYMVLACAETIVRRCMPRTVAWMCVFLMLSSWMWISFFAASSDGEEAVYARKSHDVAVDPLAVDEEGESLFTRAAALGHVRDVHRIISACSPDGEQLAAAGLRAAAGNKVDVLDALAGAGMTAWSTVDGVPLLHAAAQNGSCEAMQWLIMRGAQVNSRDEAGSTPLMQATQSGNVHAVQMLLEYGADRNSRDASGMRAENYARSTELQLLLSPQGMPTRTQ